MSIPAELRDRLRVDYAPVRVLWSPWTRAMSLLPFAAVALLAAPFVFNVRADAERLGWFGVWGLSLVQLALGLLMIGAALRESVPGRDWSPRATAAWLLLPVAAVIAVTLASWEVSPTFIRRDWWQIGTMCFSGSAASALPMVALAGILAARAYPTRPAVAGAILGGGAGLMADAGWRIFCHFSEPAHVLSAHLAAVLVAALIGSLAAVWLTRGTRVR